MTSSSSLYGTVSTQNSSSSNSTSLYGEAGTPIPDSSGNVIVRGTLTVNGCAILTNCSSFSFLPLNATSIGIGGSATSIGIGSGSGTTTINNQLATANYAFPVADGTANQVLTTNGSGVLSFTDVGSLDTNYNIDASATSGGANLNLTGSDGTTDTVKFASGTGISVNRDNANQITITNTAPVDPYNIDATTTTGGANLNLNNSAGTDSVAFKGGGTTTVTRTSADIITITSTDANTTYDFNATAATGGANLNLVGSDSTTDTVKLTDGGGITATYTSGTVVTLGSTATSANTANAIVARDASGNFSAGTIRANIVQALAGGPAPTNGLILYSDNATKAVRLYDDLFQLTSGAYSWYLNADGKTQLPGYTLPYLDGTANQILATDGLGQLNFTSNPIFAGGTFGNITVGVATDNTITTTSGDLEVAATGNNGVNITSGSDDPTFITRNSTPTNTNIRSLGLNSRTSGTPAVGIGNSIEFNVETAVGVDSAGGYLSVTSTDVTPGSEDFKMSFGLMQNGAAYSEKAFIDSVGNMTLDGDLTVNDAVVFNGSSSGSVSIAAPAYCCG